MKFQMKHLSPSTSSLVPVDMLPAPLGGVPTTHPPLPHPKSPENLEDINPNPDGDRMILFIVGKAERFNNTHQCNARLHHGLMMRRY